MLKNPKNASTRSASTEKSPIISTASPFVLRLSKDERRFFSRITFHSSLFRYSLESVPHISSPPRCHHALHGNSLAPGEYRGRWDGPKAPFQALRLLRPFCSSRARKSDHGNQDFNQA